jgi:hypothetical protein
VNEAELFQAIIEKQTTAEIEAIAFNLMKSPRQKPSLDLLSLLPHYDKFRSLVNAFFVKYKCNICRFLRGNICIINPSSLSAEIGRYAKTLRDHPQYLDVVIKEVSHPHNKEYEKALFSALTEHNIPYQA